MISTLDLISNGRVELGIGAGWYEQEFRAYGYHFPSHITRIKQLDESLSIIKEMWLKNRASFEGRYYTIHDNNNTTNNTVKNLKAVVIFTENLVRIVG
jgi:alkanesulfonate monooxygenase SsuD/methylene tetrahydromethanopterin reductase-like flavin-dependent oxidoreductase (luciferase family)